MIAAIVVAVLLVVFPSLASAECAWVEWNRLQIDKRQFDWAPGTVYPTHTACRTALGRTMYLAEPGSVWDWWLWLTNHGPYDPKRPRTGSKDFTGAFWTEDGAISVSGPNDSVEFRCLPETMTPNGPKRDTR